MKLVDDIPVVRPALAWRRYDLADRGRYAFNDAHVEPALFATLTTRLLDAFPSTPRGAATATWTQLAHGDYAMLKDDAKRAAALGPHLEATVDLSAAASDEAQVVWHDSSSAIVLPQRPGSAVLVDCRRVPHRYERYVTHRIGTALILRLRLVLPVAPEA